MLTITQKEYIDDKTGRTIIRLTPTLQTDCCATGTLTFACWEVWSDDSYQTIQEARDKAIANAREVLTRYANE